MPNAARWAKLKARREEQQRLEEEARQRQAEEDRRQAEAAFVSADKEDTAMAQLLELAKKDLEEGDGHLVKALAEMIEPPKQRPVQNPGDIPAWKVLGYG